jgi:WhiB family transcriptional regulator, redox-sensing transcriptional regulator
MTPDLNLRLIALDRVRRVRLAALDEIVRRDGACMWPAAEPVWLDEPMTDRELAERLCGGCTVRDECLELELRIAGRSTVGVWGGLTDDDRRALFPLWERRRLS